MRIGVNGYYLTTPYSGIGQYTANLLTALSEIDHKNEYFIFVPQGVTTTLPANFHITVIKPLPFFLKTFLNRFFWEEYQLGSAIKKYAIDLFHGMYQSLPQGAEKIANVVTIHDAIPWRFPFERKRRLYKWYSDMRKKFIVSRAKKVVTISEATKIDFAPVYDIAPETIEVTYEAVNPTFNHKPSEKEIHEFQAQYKISRPFILYVGGLKRHKNLRMLIKAFAILVNEYHYKGDLVIVGSIRKTMAVSSAIYVTVEGLQKYATLKGVDQQVKFIGNVSQEDLSTFMHEAGCFVSISLYEGFGLPALEAMTSGTPSVLSNLGAYPEIADGGARFVYPYDPHSIAKAIHEVVSDKKLHEQLVHKGFERAKFFDPEKIAKRILEIYEEVYDDYKVSYQP